VRYEYDDFDRLATTSFMGRELKYNYNPVTSRLTGTSLALNGGIAKTEFTYKDTEIVGTGNLLAGNVTQMRHTLPNGQVTEFDYSYKQGSGNIESISVNDAPQHTYEYDKIGQLIRDNTTTYSYNLGGNLTHINGVERFKYGQNTAWKDQLTEADGKTLTYDALGNLKTYDGSTYIWQKGSQLTAIFGAVNAAYTYDYTGLRSSKTVGAARTEYLWAGDLLMAQIGSDGNTITWSYDQGGTMLGFSWTSNGVTEYFYYVRSLQGDVVKILNDNGDEVGTYEYDAWGNITSILGAMAFVNPIRYRGYYYDSETGYYYCQSRYYNPVWCRWISADAYMDTRDGILGTNMYAYCQGDPVNSLDSSGSFKKEMHREWTEKWAYDFFSEQGFAEELAEDYAKTFAKANANVDLFQTPINIFSPMSQSWHFNINSESGGMDSRLQRYNESYARARDFAKDGDTNSMLKELGRGLHARQDMITHTGQYGNIRETIYVSGGTDIYGFTRLVPVVFYRHPTNMGIDDFEEGDAKFDAAYKETIFVLKQFMRLMELYN
jgi:RHS repeat-associated protein